MGFRSNFITEDKGGAKVPQWFAQKYPQCYITNGDTFPIIQPIESKFYDNISDTDIFLDIQKVLQEDENEWVVDVVLILLHECGGITRVKISTDSISASEPTGWKPVARVEHDYCYGCSDIKNVTN